MCLTNLQSSSTEAAAEGREVVNCLSFALLPPTLALKPFQRMLWVGRYLKATFYLFTISEQTYLPTLVLEKNRLFSDETT